MADQSKEEQRSLGTVVVGSVVGGAAGAVTTQALNNVSKLKDKIKK